MFFWIFTWGRKVESDLDWCRNNGVINFHEKDFYTVWSIFYNRSAETGPEKGQDFTYSGFLHTGEKTMFYH